MNKRLSLGLLLLVISAIGCQRDPATENGLVHSVATHAASVKELAISRQNIEVLSHLQDYPSLEVLSIQCLEDLQSLPDSIGALGKLKELRIDNGNDCVMNPRLPESIGNLHSLEKLVLYGAQDPRFGGEKGPQPQERHPFPKSMSQLKNVAYLELGHNGFDEVPAFVKALPNLRELGLGWNNLKALPPALSNLRELRTLNLEGNDLEDVPASFAKLPHLSKVTIGYNCKITQSQEKMKSLKRRFPKLTFDFTDEYDCPSN